MPASKWLDLETDIDWIKNDERIMNDMLMQPLLTKVNPRQDEETSNQSVEDDLLSKLPDELPILPLRGVVVYPETTVPLTIGQPRSIRLVDDVVAKDRIVGLVAARDPDHGKPRAW